MVYVALLRGINVGGKSRVEMSKLKATFERLGFANVKTYINSGNVIFVSSKQNPQQLASLIEQAVEKDFRMPVAILVKDLPFIKSIMEALTPAWQNNQTMKCDVMFLWKDLDNPSVLEQFSVNPQIEDVRYVPGAVLWRIDRQYVTKSKMAKIIGTELYKKLTIRNCNTVRKLYDLMFRSQSAV